MHFLYAWVLLLWYQTTPPGVESGPASTLIVFTQATTDQFFIQESLPAIEQLAQEMGVALERREVADGFPAELSSSPALVFQNYRGRSVYAGRYQELSTVRNFIRTSRRFPQQVVDNCRTEVLAWEEGRSKLAAPVKLTELQGSVPADYSATDFQNLANQALAKGMAGFDLRAEFCLQKSDRTFYLDFHPYRGENDELFVSAEIYCQFSCIDPIWSNFTQPAQGTWAGRNQLMEQLGKDMEAIILEHLKTATNGDALSVVKAEVPVKSWEALGFELPAAPASAEPTIDPDLSLGANWVYYEPLDEETPVVQFRFPEPLERYAGEVKSIRGDLELTEDLALKAGRFEVDVASMTMGMADLDAKVLKEYLRAKKFPKASFTFQDLSGFPALAWGQTANGSVRGTFEMMRIEKEVVVATQLTPVLGEQGQALLQVETSFSLNITDDFRIKGPDGPDPAKKTLLFNLNFLLQAAG